MIKSMTGYGRCEEAWADGTVTVELKSVNHRFCEIVVRLPRTLLWLEEELRRMIQQRCVRGRIELIVSFSGGKESGKSLKLDRTLARQYYDLLRELQQDLGLRGSIDIGVLAGFRDIITVIDRPVDERRLVRTVKRLTTEALLDLDGMRRREGAVLARDTKARLRVIRDELSLIAMRAPVVVQGYFDRMKARIKKLVEDVDLDVGRLSQELAIYADRCDVTEELTRLGSHLAQFDAALKSREPIGRTLDFLLQEIGREINTIGSKANDADIAVHVVRVKGEIEKVREQVQNIE